jgi:hypothetical protein
MYTYAFLPNPAVPLDLPVGIVSSLKLISEGKVAALVEPELVVEPLQQDEERLIQAVLCHDRVIRQVFEQTAVLPLRFGTCFVSHQGLQEHLQAHALEYSQKLTDLQGKAEYTLKLSPLELTEPLLSSDLSDLKGKDYFLAKKQRYQTLAEQQQQQQSEFQQIVGAIAASYPDRVFGESKAKDGVERVYLLCDRQEEPALHQHLKDWQVQCRHWQLELGTALPPYHFV